MSRLFLVRHGQASFGSDDYDRLSEQGAAQCRRLAAHWDEIRRKVAWVASGRLQRQLHSARCFQEARGADASAIRIVDGLEEYDHQALLRSYRQWSGQGTDAAVVLDRKAFHRELTAALMAWVQGDLAGVENYADFRQRSVSAINGLLASLGRSENAVVFGSAGSLAAALQPLLGIDDAAAMQLKLNFYNSSVCSLLHDGQQATLECLNSIAHLEHPDHLQLVSHR